MSAKANQPLRNGHTKARQLSLASLQPLSWSFDQMRRAGAATDTSSAMFAQTDNTHRRNLGTDSELSEYSSSSSDLLQLDQVNTQDTEMLDAPVADETTPTDDQKKSATQAATSSSQNSPVIWLYDDGESVEVTGSRLMDANSGGVGNSESLTSFHTGSDTPRQAPMKKRAEDVRDGHWRQHNRPQSCPKADQNQESPLALRSSSSLSREPDFEILDAAIARKFPVFEKTKPGLNKYLSDADFAQGIKANSSTSPLEIDDDDNNPPEDITSENFIVEHLRTLVISPPENHSLRPERTGGLQKFEVGIAKHKELHLKEGVTVELRNGSFLWIQSLRSSSYDLIIIKGYRLVRCEHFGSRLPDQRQSELVWVNKIEEDKYRAGMESALEEEPATNVKRVCEVIYTNRPWPEVSYGSDQENRGLRQNGDGLTARKENGTLYCRWKHIQVQSIFKKETEASLSLLDEDEARDRGWLQALEVRKQWRGCKGVIPGGSSTKTSFNVETGETSALRQYSTGDCFCGAGGVSRGAIQAGLHVAWGFDKDGDAIETHHKNFARFGTKSLQMDDAEFLDMIKDRPEEYTVDHAHYSPPCQPFSAANHNKNVEGDFVNQKALFSLHHLTERLKPRIVTIEETAGLLNRHRQWFDTLVNIFTSLGYSLRWKVVPCQDYGVPQSRARLLLTAAARPGERLPRFPEPTHGEGIGLKPYVKIRDVIYNIPTFATHQNIISASKNPDQLIPFSDDSFAKCITTSGGQNNHYPLGGRKYSVRELACLQGFPTNHDFSTKGIGIATRQVGNAVPPTLCKPWFETVIKSLKRTDRIDT